MVSVTGSLTLPTGRKSGSLTKLEPDTGPDPECSSVHCVVWVREVTTTGEVSAILCVFSHLLSLGFLCKHTYEFSGNISLLPTHVPHMLGYIVLIF